MASRRTHPRTLLLSLVALLAAVALLGSCSSSKGDDAGSSGKGGSPGGGDSGQGATTTTQPPVRFALDVADGAKDVRLDQEVTVKATGGALKAVSVLPQGSPEGTPSVPGTVGADGTWASTGALAPATTYEVTALGMNAADQPTTEKWTFTTLTPTAELHTRINVFEGHTYGVGMPLMVQFTTPIPEAKRAEVLKRLTVTTTPAIEGGWHWFTDSEVHWRPAQYWPAGTKASITVDFAGLDLGTGGVWGVDGRTIDFQIGDSHISTVDAVTHQMTVTVNGAVVKTIPVSTGRDQYPTKSGIHAVNEKEAVKTMDSSTVGIPRDSPDGYYETVKWDVRISNSGEFVHAAPWSTGSQGSANVSHGCVNVSDADGEWFYDFTQLGDVVQVLNTPEQLAPDNGYGDWQIPWASWVN